MFLVIINFISRSDGGSSTSSSEESPVYREKRSPVSSCSSPNKLFEALLATLPYLNEMENNVNQFSDVSFLFICFISHSFLKVCT